VIIRIGCDPASTGATSAALVLSPQPTRWSSKSHMSPGRVTGFSGTSGTLSGSVSPLDPKPARMSWSRSGSKADQIEIETGKHELTKFVT
jgi:hypothetical protein